MKLVFVTDLWAYRFYDCRLYSFLPACVAVERPNWDIHVYWKEKHYEVEGSDPVNDIVADYGGANKVKNFVNAYQQILDDEGDVLIFLCGAPTWVAAINMLLTSLDHLKKRFSCIVYYVLDNWEGWNRGLWTHDTEGRNWRIAEVERALLQHCDYALAVSPQLCKYIHYRYGKNAVFWLPNAVCQRYYRTNTPPYIGEKLVAVYVGVWIPHRHEGWKEALRDVALKFPHIQFYIVGGKWKVEAVSTYYGNLYFLPTLPAKGHAGIPNDLSVLLRNASFGLVLQGKGVFGYYADPTKWYLYHAAGRPILSMNTPHHFLMPSFYPYTVCCTDLEEGIREMERRLRAGEFTDLKIMEEHDYLHRAKAFIALLERGEAVYGKVEAGKWESRW